MREIWDIIHQPKANFSTKVDRLLELESAHFDLPYGFFTRIDQEADKQIIEIAHGSHDLLQPGKTAPLTESYCRKTIQQPDGTFRIDDAFAEGYETDPGYQRFQLGTYVGSTVGLENQPYGTLCFASSDPRETPLDESELMLVEMLATWASDALSERRTKEQLRRQNKQMEELAGQITHDLRNPLTLAQGQAQLLQESVQQSMEKIERAHTRMGELVDDILTFARLEEPVREPSAVDLEGCVSKAWELGGNDEATLSLAFEDVTVYADEERLTRLFENLFRNAIEHGGDAVAIDVGTMEGGFYVSDNGPGIPESERETVFTPGYSSVTGNTGFGLSIVRRVAHAHGWDVSITTSSANGVRFNITGVDTAP
jgi:signal transduction histidine kinase